MAVETRPGGARHRNAGRHLRAAVTLLVLVGFALPQFVWNWFIGPRTTFDVKYLHMDEENEPFETLIEHRQWLAHIRSMQEKHQPRQQYLKRPDTPALMPHDVYDGLNAVPPLAVAAFALGELMKVIELPDGTLHGNESLQVMGGLGYTQETLVEYCVRRSRGWMIAGGSIEMMKNRLGEIIFERRFSQRPPRAPKTGEAKA